MLQITAFACGVPLKGSGGKRILEPPASGAASDPTLQHFLDGIKAVVGRRSAAELLGYMGPVFRVEFSVGKGPAAFRDHWHPQNPESEVWRVLDRLFAIPGTFYSRTLYATPYVYTQFPFDLDPFAHVVVLTEGTELRREPDVASIAVGKLGYEIVRLDQPLLPPVRLDRLDWLKVISEDGSSGYVRSSEVYSPAGHRAFFEKQGGRWRWISLACSE